MYTLTVLFLATIVLSVTIGPSMRLFCAMFGTFLFSFYLVIDTQMIVGGKNKNCHRISEDSYILASVLLYLDIINLFLYILEMVKG